MMLVRLSWTLRLSNVAIRPVLGQWKRSILPAMVKSIWQCFPGLLLKIEPLSTL